MTDEKTDQRSRDLECDRLMSAGLFMGALTIAVTRFAARTGAFAGLIDPHGAARIFAPLIVLGAVTVAIITMLVAAGEMRRPVAAAAVVFGSCLTAVAVPFLQQSLALFINGASLAWSGALMAFLSFGLCAAVATEDLHPTPAHVRRSAIITVIALFMAATDGTGVFACILSVMGFIFFTFWRERPKA